LAQLANHLTTPLATPLTSGEWESHSSRLAGALLEVEAPCRCLALSGHSWTSWRALKDLLTFPMDSNARRLKGRTRFKNRRWKRRGADLQSVFCLHGPGPEGGAAPATRPGVTLTGYFSIHPSLRLFRQPVLDQMTALAALLSSLSEKSTLLQWCNALRAGVAAYYLPGHQ
jgi:hypothetical protein